MLTTIPADLLGTLIEAAEHGRENRAQDMNDFRRDPEMEEGYKQAMLDEAAWYFAIEGARSLLEVSK